ncbi:MAG: allantoate amidohydrolase [Propionibacteriaceae bacterium]
MGVADTRSFDRMWSDLTDVGRDPAGGYARFAWTAEDALLREWFAAQGQSRGLDLTRDRNGNSWAWWGDPDAAAGGGVVFGSHLDSVPQGGAFDGPLGVVSALAALDRLRAAGFVPERPIGIACFTDEEGARFGVACAGSRLLTGVLDAGWAHRARDTDGISWAEAARSAGHDVAHLGRDDETLSRVGTFVELHVEQGRGLVDLDQAVAVGREIWPHGRFRVDLAGRADHAGTTRLADRQDPMLDLARLVLEARAAAVRHDAVATVGKVAIDPGAVNAIPAHVTAWLDARGADERRVRRLIADLQQTPGLERLVQESWTGATVLDPDLAAQLAAVIAADADAGTVPVLPTGAGHDAGILSTAGIPSAMLFVRNPTGVSHSPEEFAEAADCHRGVAALATVMEHLAGPSERA